MKVLKMTLKVVDDTIRAYYNINTTPTQVKEDNHDNWNEVQEGLRNWGGACV